MTMDGAEWTMNNEQRAMSDGQGTIEDLQPLKTGVRHVLTHQRLTADFYLLDINERPPLPSGFIWVDERDLHLYAVPRLVEMLFEAVSLSKR